MSPPPFEVAARRVSVCVAFAMLAAAALSLFTRTTLVLSLVGPAVLGVMLVQLADYGSYGAWLPNAFTFARVLVVAWLARIGVQLTGPALATALLLVFFMDGLDGFVARTTQTTSAQGAQFDAEADAFVILTVSVIHTLRGLSPWVLVAGLVPYAFAILVDVFELDGVSLRTRAGRYAGAVALTGLALAAAPHDARATLLAMGSTFLLAGSASHTLYSAYRALTDASRAPANAT